MWLCPCISCQWDLFHAMSHLCLLGRMAWGTADRSSEQSCESQIVLIVLMCVIRISTKDQTNTSQFWIYFVKDFKRYSRIKMKKNLHSVKMEGDNVFETLKFESALTLDIVLFFQTFCRRVCTSQGLLPTEHNTENHGRIYASFGI